MSIYSAYSCKDMNEPFLELHLIVLPLCVCVCECAHVGGTCRSGNDKTQKKKILFGVQNFSAHSSTTPHLCFALPIADELRKLSIKKQKGHIKKTWLCICKWGLFLCLFFVPFYLAACCFIKIYCLVMLSRVGQEGPAKDVARRGRTFYGWMEKSARMRLRSGDGTLPNGGARWPRFRR